MKGRFSCNYHQQTSTSSRNVVTGSRISVQGLMNYKNNNDSNNNKILLYDFY